MPYTLHHGDCLEILRTMPDNSVDSIVTDPPYGLSFMGRKWDYDVPSQDIWAECLRVLKPGGHLLAFAGARTQHRMAVRIEDAGFEIRDMIAWVYGSGFPKSLDVSKAIDKAAGAEGGKGAVTGKSGSKRNSMAGDFAGGDYHEYLPATDAARQWQGWGTALKPALEPITVARKPLTGTVAENVLQHGTGAINVDGCRVPCEDGDKTKTPVGYLCNGSIGPVGLNGRSRIADEHPTGRWPANLIHDGGDEVLAGFPETKNGGQNTTSVKGDGMFMTGSRANGVTRFSGDTGSAARFFYCAKANKRDRNEGCEHLAVKQYSHDGRETPIENAYRRNNSVAQNNHPTVKPTDLMAYLCRLVTPPGGVVLDPFMGSGSTGKAAMREGFRFIGCEMSPEYMEIARARIIAAFEQALDGLA